MAKRLAEGQITKDDNAETYSIDKESPIRHVAAPEVMAKRKILRPKGRSFEFANSSKDMPTSLANHDSTSKLKAVKLRALAQQFESAVFKTRSAFQIPDYRPIVQKYLDFYTNIEMDTKPYEVSSSGLSNTQDGKTESSSSVIHNPFAQIAGTIDPTTKPELEEHENGYDSSSNLGHERPSAVQGPAFKLSQIPTTKSPAFAISTSEVGEGAKLDNEVRGPTFTFTKNIRDPVFKLPSPAEASRSGSSQPSESKVAEAGDVSLKSKQSKEEKSTIGDEDVTKNPSDEDEVTAHSETQVISDPDVAENILLQVKAKLLLLDTKNEVSPYKSLGVGNLKILRPAQSLSSRVLMRSEGGLQVLLNALLIKDVEYTKFGNGCFVQLPAVDDNSNLVTYVLKVATAESGEKLRKILNEAKSL